MEHILLSWMLAVMIFYQPSPEPFELELEGL
jgi:hypothetical protein